MAEYDLIVIGAGAGGTGAALTAARRGLRVLWVDKERTPGGTGVHALVNVWQPGYGTSPLAREIAERLVARGTAIYTRPQLDTPQGRPLYRRDPLATYDSTLVRWGDKSQGLLAPAVTYEPVAMARLLAELALQAGVELALETVLLEARTEPAAGGQRHVTSVLLQGPEGLRKVAAEHYVDSTASIALARAAGCAYTLGREARDEYDEPSAPVERELKLNGCTLCFLCRPGEEHVALPRETGGPDGSWAHISQMPWGGWHVNLCYQMDGEAAWQMGPEQARDLLLRNIARRWPAVKAAYGLDHCGIAQLAARVGVREGPRLVARYVLTENDYHRGQMGAHHPDCIVWTDHALDRHSPDGGCTEAENGPVGIPLRCLQLQEVDNLLVACRGAGFTSLAGSAVRLQRTMMELGEAAANAIAHRGPSYNYCSSPSTVTSSSHSVPSPR